MKNFFDPEPDSWLTAARLPDEGTPGGQAPKKLVNAVAGDVTAQLGNGASEPEGEGNATEAGDPLPPRTLYREPLACPQKRKGPD